VRLELGAVLVSGWVGVYGFPFFKEEVAASPLELQV